MHIGLTGEEDTADVAHLRRRIVQSKIICDGKFKWKFPYKRKKKYITIKSLLCTNYDQYCIIIEHYSSGKGSGLRFGYKRASISSRNICRQHM
jgi:uncharacterized protein YvpB